MSSESVPLPQGHDLQMESTQAMATKAHTVQQLASEAISLGHRLYQNHKDKKPQVRVEIGKGTTHQALWEKYNEGVQPSQPIQRTLNVARSAIKDGQSLEEVQTLLQHDPLVTKIKQQQGQEKAQEYIRVITRSAAYREQQAQNSQQQSRQQQKTRTQTQQVGIRF